VGAGAPPRESRGLRGLGPAAAALAAALRIHLRPRRRRYSADVQHSAGYKEPHTTRRYDSGRDSLDRNAAYTVAAYLA
jgi:hypothetical protein